MRLGFVESLVPLVLNGSRTLTYRLGEKWNSLQVGQRVEVENSATGHPVATVEIVSKRLVLFHTLSIDRAGHETYVSKEEQRAVFERIYGRRIADGDLFTVLEFKLVDTG